MAKSYADPHAGGALNNWVESTELACMFSSLLSWNSIVIRFYAKQINPSSPRIAVKGAEPDTSQNHRSAKDECQADGLFRQPGSQQGCNQRKE